MFFFWINILWVMRESLFHQLIIIFIAEKIKKIDAYHKKLEIIRNYYWIGNIIGFLEKYYYYGNFYHLQIFLKK